MALDARRIFIRIWLSCFVVRILESIFFFISLNLQRASLMKALLKGYWMPEGYSFWSGKNIGKPSLHFMFILLGFITSKHSSSLLTH